MPNLMKFFLMMVFGGLWMKSIIIYELWEIYFDYNLDIKPDHHVYRNDAKPFAKRIVLIACDGLTLENLEMYEDQTAFLTEQKRGGGVWGLAQPQGPMQCHSGLGPDGILSGIPKDHSLLYNDWMANETEIDTIIKQCNNAYFWGSSLISPSYGKVSIQAYFDPNTTKFKEHTRERHDNWVLNRLRNNLKNRRNTECGKFCEQGNLFIVHLLGMDAFPSLQPTDPDKYMSKLTINISEMVQKITEAFDLFFEDHDDTAYIFLSKQGILNCGSPGENDLLVIGWGAGLATNSDQQDINQIDLAPLIANMLGINIPITSKGHLPLHYLNGAIQQKAGALMANIRQIVEQLFKITRNDKSYIQFNKTSTTKLSETMEKFESSYKSQRYEYVLNNGPKLIDLCLGAIRRYNDYNVLASIIWLNILFFLWCLCMVVYMGWQPNVFTILITLCQVLILVYSYFNRRILALAFFIVAIWGYNTYKNLTAKLTERWFYTLALMSTLLFAPVVKEFSFLYFGVTIMVFLIICKKFCGEIHGLIVIVFSCTNAAGMAWIITNGYKVPLSCYVTYCVMLNSSLGIVWRTRHQMINRLNAIVCALFCNYIHLVEHREGMVYCALVVLLYTWIELELRHMRPTENANSVWALLTSLYFDTCPRERYCITHEDIRRALFFITFIVAIVSRIEDSTNINYVSYWLHAKEYSSITNQPTYARINLIGHTCIPILLCACAYIIILRVTRSNIPRSFGTLMLLSNLFNYLFFVLIISRYNDTWKDLILDMSRVIFATGLSIVWMILSFVAVRIMCRYESSRTARRMRLDRWLNVQSLQFHCINFSNYYNVDPQED